MTLHVSNVQNIITHLPTKLSRYNIKYRFYIKYIFLKIGAIINEQSWNYYLSVNPHPVELYSNASTLLVLVSDRDCTLQTEWCVFCVLRNSVVILLLCQCVEEKFSLSHGPAHQKGREASDICQLLAVISSHLHISHLKTTQTQCLQSSAWDWPTKKPWKMSDWEEMCRKHW